MKKALFIFLIVFTAGCAYLDDPKSIFKDPHYADYKQRMDNLESAYFGGDIGYTEYIKQKNQLDEDYSRDVQERDAILRGEK